MAQTIESAFIGKKAPAFSLQDQNGMTRRLADYHGQYVVLYWYPKDDTPGCTAETCGFRDTQKEFAEFGAAVLGISILDAASKKKFADKFSVQFPLLADEDHAVAEQYGVWREKSLFGWKYLGICRETFIIDPQGKIAMHWPKAGGSGKHAREALNWLKKNVKAK